MSEVQLKPCPFCGNKAKIINGEEIYVQCQDCLAMTGSFPFATDAVREWQRRTCIHLSRQGGE